MGCSLCCAAVAILFFGAVGTLIAWVCDSPYEPLLFAEASISGYNFTADNYLTSNFDVHFTSLNPNSHYVIYLSNIEVSVYNDGVLVADQVFTDTFASKPKAPLTLKLGLSAHNMSVSDGLIEDLRIAGSSGGEASLGVEITADTRIVLKGWKEFDDYVTKATCSPLPVMFNSSSAARYSGSRTTGCSVDMHCKFLFC